MSRVDSLFELALYQFCISLKDARSIERLEIPKSIKERARTDIKELWFWQDPLQPTETFDYSSIEIPFMTRLQFNMVMNYNQKKMGVPEFLPKGFTHVVWEYYTFYVNSRLVSVCRTCYGCMVSSAESEFTLVYWGCELKNMNIYEVRNHDRLNSSDVLPKVIHKEKNFCDLCVIGPLFDVIDRHECLMGHSYHERKNHPDYKYGYEGSSDDSDSDECHFSTKRVFPAIEEL
jgi:hypothetical protein